MYFKFHNLCYSTTLKSILHCKKPSHEQAYQGVVTAVPSAVQQLNSGQFSKSDTSGSILIEVGDVLFLRRNGDLKCAFQADEE